MSDPRKAKTLGEACMNPDGKTFNALRLMSWLSEIVSPGRGLSVEECRELAQENINRRKARKQSDGK